jgi:hypothetical protein
MIVFDIIPVYRLRFPGQGLPEFIVDEEWEAFNNERPVGDYSYTEWLEFAQEQRRLGYLADWNALIRAFPENSLLEYLLVNKSNRLRTSIALLDMLMVLSYPVLRRPEIVRIFWNKLVEAVRRDISVHPTAEVIEGWNRDVDRFLLPEFLYLPTPETALGV